MNVSNKFVRPPTTEKISADAGKITSDGNGNLTAVSYVGDGSGLTGVVATLGVLVALDSDTHKITSDGAGNLTAVSYVGDGSALTGVLKPTGTAGQFIKGDGSFDSSVYLTDNGLPDITDVGGVVNITGTDLQFGGVSILGGGGGGTGNWVFSGDTITDGVYSITANDSANLHLSGGGNAEIWLGTDGTFNLQTPNACMQGTSAGLVFFAQNAKPISFGMLWGAPVQSQLYLDSAGVNVGFGNTAPLYPVDVTGTVNASNGYSAGGVAGFTGTGAYTNFTIAGGIITAAS